MNLDGLFLYEQVNSGLDARPFKYEQAGFYFCRRMPLEKAFLIRPSLVLSLERVVGGPVALTGSA